MEGTMFPTRCRYCGASIYMHQPPGENWRAVEVQDQKVIDHKPACLETLRKRDAAVRAAAWKREHPEVTEKARKRHRVVEEASEMDREFMELFKGGSDT